MRVFALLLLGAVLFAASAIFTVMLRWAGNAAPVASESALLPSSVRSFEDTQRLIDDLLWFHRLGDIAVIEKFEIASSLPRREKDPTSRKAGQSIVLPTYVFRPRSLTGRAPLLVFAHSGVHGRLTSSHAHVFREALDRGFVIVSPEYRGSMGHGQDLFNQIDYGGAEIDDTHDARNWAVANLPFVDPGRVGIFGWSHGGYHALMNVFRWPEDYRAAYAGVPVSDLMKRMEYMGPEYRAILEESIGRSPEADPAEYKRRSPVHHAARLKTPLLIHATTHDEDVDIREIESLIAALKATGRKFDYRIYDRAPGGHRFNQIDTALARESRREMWDFLQRNLE